MRRYVITILLCLATGAFGGTVNIGDTKEMVVDAIGRPMGKMKKGDKEVLLFANGELELEAGRVVGGTLPQLGRPTNSRAVKPSGLRHT